MILLKDLFTMLAAGEFSNLSISRADTGTIHEQEYDRLITNLNLGIVELYKRFNFLENEINLHTIPSVQKYFIRNERVGEYHALNHQVYLANPGVEEGRLNIIEIKAVLDSTGEELTIGNRFLVPAIKKMSPDSLRITGLTAPEVFTIVYQAYPCQVILDDDFDLEEYYLDIPPVIVSPLLFFIASRIFKPIGDADANYNPYQPQYELACQKLELYGLENDDEDEVNTFEEEGWV